MPAVLALGLDPAFVDPKAMGGLSPAIVRAFIDAQLDRVRDFDCILIGAGVRADEQLRLFEKLLNVVHALAPGAKICFNTSPEDSAEAVQRWV